LGTIFPNGNPILRSSVISSGKHLTGQGSAQPVPGHRLRANIQGMTPGRAAWIFAGLVAVVAAFQLALAFGAPWGRFAMGGSHPGTYPPELRLAAVAQMTVLLLFAVLILSRAGVVLPAWRRVSRWLSWLVVGIMAASLALNLATPSPAERLIWAPVALVLLLTSLRVAVGR